jgi:thiol-disulfide isomerase/thioredoxin
VQTRPILTLLGRDYCHLCDEMREALAPIAARYDAEVVVRDVDSNADLEAQYGERVPVLLLGSPPSGVELCHFTLDIAAIEAALRRP